MAILFLHELLPGETGRVLEIHTKGSMRRRFLDLGLIPGTEVKCIGRSPGGDPTAYQIRGAVVAIRRVDGASIRVSNGKEG